MQPITIAAKRTNAQIILEYLKRLSIKEQAALLVFREETAMETSSDTERQCNSYELISLFDGMIAYGKEIAGRNFANAYPNSEPEDATAVLRLQISDLLVPLFNGINYEIFGLSKGAFPIRMEEHDASW